MAPLFKAAATSNENRTTHSINVTCFYTECADRGVDKCVVTAMAAGRITRTGKYSVCTHVCMYIMNVSYVYIVAIRAWPIGLLAYYASIVLSIMGH